MKSVKAGIAGAAGYTGGELLRLLVRHPHVEVVFAHSKSAAGKKWYEVHHDLLGITERGFTAGLSQDIDVLFLCVGHGEARRFLEEHELNPSIRIIDLSTDFRDQENARLGDREFVYGLPELNREKLHNAKNIANPGCFATAIQLALLPLAAGLPESTAVHVQATTGSTGAGQKATQTTHFSWRDNNLSIYKAFTHQHLKEIGESLRSLNPHFPEPVFVPQRGNFSRGILAVAVLETEAEEDMIRQEYESYYAGHPFTCIAPFEVALKQVVNTNFCYLGLQKEGRQLLVVSVIDNLLKGASGQAVQNMNLMFGLPEDAGLQLKASVY